MPIYEYECDSCHEVTELWQNMSDDPLTRCPKCGGPVHKLISQSSFQLKGGGWYADGYSSSSGSSPAPAAKSVKKTEKPAACPNAASCPCAS